MKQTTGGSVEDSLYPVGHGLYTNLSKWPTDATAVLAKLRSEANGSGMKPIDAEAFQLAGDALRETAAPPAVRAAIFAAVARMQGVRALGTATDHGGRPGIGFEIDSDAHHDSRWELIFDPATSALLGERTGSIRGGYNGWVDYIVSELVPAIPAGGNLVTNPEAG